MIAWSGKSAYKNDKGEVIVNKLPSNIFASFYYLKNNKKKKVRQIIMPDNSNMHIFAISMMY